MPATSSSDHFIHLPLFTALSLLLESLPIAKLSQRGSCIPSASRARWVLPRANNKTSRCPALIFMNCWMSWASHWLQSSSGNWGHSGIAGKLSLCTMYVLIAMSPLPCSFLTNQSFQSAANSLLSQMLPARCCGGFFGTDTCVCVAGGVGWYRKNGKILNQRKSSGNRSFSREMGPFLWSYILSHIQMRLFLDEVG